MRTRWWFGFMDRGTTSSSCADHAVGESAELCSHRSTWNCRGACGKAWDTSDETPNGEKPAKTASTAGFSWRQTEGHIQAAELRVMECVAAAAEKFNIATDRCFLAGYSSGGTMAFRIALRNPQYFAGVLSLRGPFPSSRSPLAKLHHVRRLEVFIACCPPGSLYPTDTVCDDFAGLLHTAGMSVVLREYPGDDMLTPQMLARHGPLADGAGHASRFGSQRVQLSGRSFCWAGFIASRSLRGIRWVHVRLCGGCGG